MIHSRPRHDISVLMPAHNAEPHILQSVQSVLGQTHEDFELIVVNDGSTDRTAEILAGIADRRLRILDNPANLGVVGSLNRGMAAATGRYIARIDADDYCLPTRFARQRAFLEEHPETLLLGTGMSVLREGRIQFSRQPGHPDPKLLRWMLHVGNPLGHPSMMFRAEVVQRLGEYLRPALQYAEDFDFTHRVLRLGAVAMLPDHLVIYRQHETNLTQTRRAEMIARTAAVLRGVYAELLGPEETEGADLVAHHLIAGEAVPGFDTIDRLGDVLDRLIDGFEARYELDAPQRDAVIRHVGGLWWRMIQQSLRAGQASRVIRHHGARRWSRAARPPAVQLARSVASGLLHRPAWLRKPPAGGAPAAADLQLSEVMFRGLPTRGEDPPSLYVVVDTEAEFDWSRQFARSETNVSAMKSQILAQSIFDRFGVRPVYLVDYAVASQPEGYEPLRAIFDRHGCVIGAHLHPWINPPFEEDVSERNSFAGNLPPDLEERKIRALIARIEQTFGTTPLFYKAGRYGIGPHTMDILRRLGFVVDFSIMPMADMRPQGGPDFRQAAAQPYEAVESGILTLPMTRGQVGLAAPMPQPLHSAVHSDRLRRWRVPGLLSHLRLNNTVTLTPEGVAPGEQVQLIRTMLARGLRSFVLHYHSSSLGMHTPYVRNESELVDFIENITAVCDFFFNRLGGVPGNPADLVPQDMRDRLWTGTPAAAAHQPRPG